MLFQLPAYVFCGESIRAGMWGDMFGAIKKNLQIERALQICGADLGMYPRRFLEQMPGGAQTAWRAGLHQIMDQLRPTDHELAVILAAPYIGVVSDSTQKRRVVRQIELWEETRKVRPEVLDHFLNEAEQQPEEWIDSILGPSAPKARSNT